jgi:SAM-dependent methyltransferase
MKVSNREEVVSLLEGVYASVALGAAMEAGLFWLLADGALEASEVARKLDLPDRRCSYWLQLLCSTGLLTRAGSKYVVTGTARTAILEAYSQESWSFLAREMRERLPAVADLPTLMREPRSVWEAQGLRSPDYYENMKASPARARDFTRMLYEIHLSMAESLADSLDMHGVNRMLDLGGGSGVMTMALLRRYPGLSGVVVDIPNVCVAGRELARENGLEKRLLYHEADFTRDELPTDFDLILECDVGVYGVDLFRKFWRSLKPGGRLVIIDKFELEPGLAPETRRHWAFLSSLEDPEYQGIGVTELLSELEEAGFSLLSERELPRGESARWSAGWTIVEAQV